MKKIYLLIIFIYLTLSTAFSQDDLPDPLQAGWNDKAVCKVLKENVNIRVLKCTFEPGVGHEKHMHKAHYAYAISGSRFRIEDEKGIREVDFNSGSNYYSEGVKWHQVLNIGDSTAVVLIIEPK